MIGGKTVYIFLPFSVKLDHARVHLEREILEKHGYTVPVTGSDDIPETIGSQILNLLCFKYFKWHLVFHFKKQFKEKVKGQNVIFYDLSLLPLCRSFKKGGSRLIYETSDNNVHLTFYNLCKKWSFLKIFKAVFISFFSRLEKKWSRKYCDQVIVNSEALKRYFAPQEVVLNYYASPLEEAVPTDPGKEYALLYLGLFDVNKGFYESLELSERLQLPLFVMGKIRPESLKSELAKKPLVHDLGKKAVPEMKIALQDLSKNYALFGLSLIKAVHYSYATQEANKDMDYLAMGIPLIGNERQPTKAKIDAGCGLMLSEITDALPDRETYRVLSANALDYYQLHYRRALFEERLLSVLL